MARNVKVTSAQKSEFLTGVLQDVDRDRMVFFWGLCNTTCVLLVCVYVCVYVCVCVCILLIMNFLTDD